MASNTRQRGAAVRWAPWVLAALFTALAGLGLAGFDSSERLRWEGSERARIGVQLDILRSRLEASLNAPLLRTRGIAAHIVAQGDITQRQFDVMAEFLLRGHRNVRNMVVSRGMVIAMTYPLAGNESVLGVDYRSVPAQYAMVQKAIQTRAPVLQGPVPLIQGGTGLIARFPVFLPGPDGGEDDGPFFGMVNIILDIPGILAEAGVTRDDLPITVAIRGRDGLGERGAVIHGEEAVFGQNPVQADVQLPFGSWRLAAIPKGGWDAVDDELERTRLLLGLIFVLVGLAAFGTARYVTTLARTEQELVAKTVELERSNSDLERFAYVASHDLQTPLRNVASYTQLLERRYRGRLDADADEFIGYIVDAARRMSQMVTDLLNYARVTAEGAAVVSVPAQEALDVALTDLATDIRASGARVMVGDLPVVLAAPVQLTSVFQNLIGNAIKYRHPDRAPEIVVSAVRPSDGMVVFSVTDNGIGIEPQYSQQIFEFFQRLHPPGADQGSGVGLAVCRRIVRRFGGDIWVESVPGEGATFRFTCPAAED
ncbi:MAG TPA: ATP-binding protein [Candidatus Omnitrophota bacterium]|nr:ATP-binding protein [Candidatus Omnitrophota bacterium]